MESTRVETQVESVGESIYDINSHQQLQLSLSHNQKTQQINLSDNQKSGSEIDSFIDEEQDDPINQNQKDDSYFNQQDEIQDNPVPNYQDNIEMDLESLQDSQDQQKTNKQQTTTKKPAFKNRKVKPKKFQMVLFKNSLEKNTIIYLPTGTGKTMVSILSMFYYLSKESKDKKILFLANTIQLVKQQADAIRNTLGAIIENKQLSDQLRTKLNGRYDHLDWDEQTLKGQVCCIHGQKNEQIGMTRRKKIQSNMMSKKQFLSRMGKSRVIVMIAQMFINCLRRGYIELTNFSFIVFDECHHCTGSHPYAGIMNQFYFEKKKELDGIKDYDAKEKLPIIMGLTASPVAQPFNDPNKLQAEIQNLCINLDSNFSYFEQSITMKSETDIQIVKIEEPQEKQLIPSLINHFQKYRDHIQSFKKLQSHFPSYYQCIKKVVSFLGSRDQTLKIDSDRKKIHSLQHFVFYDLKECLLIKLRDIWLQLGQFAFVLGLNDLITQLDGVPFKNPENIQMMVEIISILKNYRDELSTKFLKCQAKNFSSKVNKLIEILSTDSGEIDCQEKHEDENYEGNQVNDMVLVFAFKRRTVKYLQKVLLKYKQQLPEEKRKNFQCVGVTGYAGKSLTQNIYDGNHTYQSDPSSQNFLALVQKNCQDFLETFEGQKKKTLGQNEGLTSQMKKILNQKMGKLLLEVEEKYSKQIKKIQDFKLKKYRVLITTSVTQEGFDIPGCNIVISFDTPASLKSYIQIKGRARKRYSKYYIFTNQINQMKTRNDKQLYDDTINATYQIAINKMAKEGIKSKKTYKRQVGYKCVPIKDTKAIINTNYALEILKSFFSSLRHPNKGYFHFIQTPNICYRCVIKFPASTPSTKSYVVGEQHTRKQTALKSAAYIAVKQLYKQGLIKSDLRPKKYQDLQDERQIEKYEDIQKAKDDRFYMQIFQKYSQIEVEVQKDNRKFMRFHFKPIQAKQLDFEFINFKFKNHIKSFESSPFRFQLYTIKFSNYQKLEVLSDQNQIGLLTCFDEDYTNQIFQGFQYNFDEGSDQKFSLNFVSDSTFLKLSEYQKLKTVHNFLIASCQNRQLQHYSVITQHEPLLAAWKAQVHKKSGYDIDKNRKYYPLIVLLKKNVSNEVVIDQKLNNKIIQYEKIFKQLYLYHNHPEKLTQKKQKFSIPLTDIFHQLLANIQNRQTVTLVQSITKDFCFHKCLIIKRQVMSKEIEQSQKEKKKNLQSRISKMNKVYDHMSVENNDVVKVNLWRKYEKDHRNQYFKRSGAIKLEQQSSTYYLLKQFMPYPLALQTLFKVSLASKYVFKALYQYSLAFHFRNQYLTQLLTSKSQAAKKVPKFVFKSYPNPIAQNSQRIFNYLYENGGSRYLKRIGQSYHRGSIFTHPLVVFDNCSLSSINQSFNTLNHTNSFSITGFVQNKSIEEKNSIKMLKIMDIRKVLTSRIYKQGIHDNYEEYQFIGDVVLKLLSTIQVFLFKPDADEGSLHIARANIICNANLHRKSIKHHIFRYILAGRQDEPAPPCQIAFDGSKVQKKYYEETSIELINSATKAQGYQYIPGKVHADVVEALIGAFYLRVGSLNECQALLYSLDVLTKPNIQIDVYLTNNYDIPQIYQKFEERIKYSFNDKGLLLQCLTHSSFRNILETLVDQNSVNKLLSRATTLNGSMSIMSEKSADDTLKSKIISSETFYERLQFLGDSIIDLIVVQFLHQKYQALDEGTFTLLKQAGVSNKTLGMIALYYGMHELILMDIQENDLVMKQFEKIKLQFNLYLNNPEQLLKLKVHALKLLGDVFEALVGAIFLDCKLNYEETKKIVMIIAGDFFNSFTEMAKLKVFPGYKFREYLQKNNYRKYRVQKDPKAGIQDGKFRFLLVDRVGNVISQCWEVNEKKAWDLMEENFVENNNDVKQQKWEDFVDRSYENNN